MAPRNRRQKALLAWSRRLIPAGHPYGGVSVLNLRGAAMSEGGVPIYMDGKIVGAIGVSGVTAEQDGQIAKAGADALK